MNYLSEEAVIDINRKVTSLSGDPFAVINRGNLDFLVSGIKYKYEYKSDEEKIILKAAFMLDLIANKGHIFAEGNKRTSITATLTFLEANQLALSEIDQVELVNFVLLVAQGKENISSIAKWISQRIKTKT